LQIGVLMARKPSQLSGGQRQRVAIGRALVKQVGLFLFDEPLSNLDAKLRTEMRIEIKKLHGQLRNTIVYVTHDQVEAMTMATRIAVMDKGVIQQIGPPDDIYDRPENVFVADFVGSPAMNMIDATARLEGGVAAAPNSGGEAFDLSGHAWRSPPVEGQKLKIGFRPEHLAPPDDAPAGRTMALDLPVQFIERSGPEAIALLDFRAKTVSARIEPSMLAKFVPGQSAAVRLALDKISVFDAVSGRRM
jgi:multiple sugar transport system ATP-binding protein